jgi:hypothetical protein
VFSIFTRKAADALGHPAFPAPSIPEGFRSNLGRRRVARPRFAARGCLTSE